MWVANYVLMGYGEGAVMAVPAHDERDFEFATQYGLPIKCVIRSKTGAYADTGAPWKDAYAEHGITVNPGKYDGLEFQQAVDAIAARPGAKGLGGKRVQYRLRDWGISRQRYWGTPIPLIHCDECGDVPVPDDQLPVVLPEDWCPTAPAIRSAKTPAFRRMQPARSAAARHGARPTPWTPSSIRPGTTCATPARTTHTAMVDERVNYWLPVDQYIGGIEHAILHLLYSRFWTKVMRDLGLVQFDEPFTNLLTQGMVLNEIFFRKTDAGRIAYYNPADVELDVRRARPAHRRQAQGRRAAGGIGWHGHHVQVQEQRRRPAGADRSVRCGHRAVLHDVRQSRRSRRWSGPTPAWKARSAS